MVLALPVATCSARAVARTDHEGKVNGDSAAAVVHRSNSIFLKAGMPSKAEGLASIMVSACSVYIQGKKKTIQLPL